MTSPLEAAIRINIKTTEAINNMAALDAAVKKTLQELDRGADFDALEKLRQQAAEGKSVGWATKLPILLAALAASHGNRLREKAVRGGRGGCPVSG